MHTPLPLTRELVLIGGGHTHALVLRKWGMNPLPGARVTVVNPHPTAPYTGMLPGYVAGHYRRDALDIDLVRLARFARARLILDHAAALDPQAHTVTLRSGRVLPYHVASVDIGITADIPDLPGFADHGISAKPLDVFSHRWADFRKTAREQKTPARIAVIGGGIGGVELALAMDHALRADKVADAQVTIIEKHSFLSTQSPGFARQMRKLLARRGIDLVEGVPVTALDSDGLTLAGRHRLPADFIVSAAGAQPHRWLADTGLDLTQGFITVDAHLRSISHGDVFAAGDCAHFQPAARPKAGVFAVRQAPVLHHNLQAALSAETLKSFHPQRDYLKLVSLGSKRAVADKWGLRPAGAAMWTLKNRIDQKFMAQFRDLRPMPVPPPPKRHALGLVEAMGDKPMCGGCGAKVGGKVLQSMLAQLPATTRRDVLSRPGDDAALLSGPGGTTQVITTDHLRAFTEDPGLMTRIAANHALGDIWAMGAAPQSALVTLILPPMSSQLQDFWVSEIMAEAEKTFSGEGADIVGGHSSMGSELTIGFTLTGLTDRPPIGLQGARPGDAIILTKAIGSGTILAGEMQMKAKGPWVANALAQMARPQGAAAAALGQAHAMTDVTGFGLAGHLAGMARASGLEIRIDPGEVQLLEGAAALAADGVRSTIYPDNRMLAPAIDPTGDPVLELLFDPQTAGGLVAAVNPRSSKRILSKLNKLGYDAKVIGQCLEGEPDLHLS